MIQTVEENSLASIDKLFSSFQLNHFYFVLVSPYKVSIPERLASETLSHGCSTI